MPTLPQPSEAGAGQGWRQDMADQIKATAADLGAYRTSLSILTSTGADLAKELETRNEENRQLSEQLAKFPPEWIKAVQSGEDLPDLGALREDRERAQAEKAEIESKLANRDVRVNELESRLSELQSEA